MFSKTKLLRWLAWSILILVLLHIFWQIFSNWVGPSNRVVADIAARFGLDDELSLPTWLSSVMGLAFAGLSWHISLNQSSKSAKNAWRLIGLAGLFVSVDEIAALHELILQGLHILADFGENQTFMNNAWVMVLPFILVGVILSIRIVARSIPKETLKNLILAGCVYLMGAAVMEYLSIPINKDLLSYQLGFVVLEESLEFIGLWMIIRAICVHIQNHEKVVRQKLSDIF